MPKIEEGSLVIIHMRDFWSTDLKRTIKRGEAGIVIEVKDMKEEFIPSMFLKGDKMYRIMLEDGIASAFSDFVRLLDDGRMKKSERNFDKHLRKMGRKNENV